MPTGLNASVCTPVGADVKGIQDFALKTVGATLPPDRFAAGFTSPGVSYTPTELDVKPIKSAKGVRCRPKKVSASVTTEARFIKPGTHPIPNLTAEVPGEVCGKKGQKLNLPLFAKVSKQISSLARKGELEHCADFGYAFQQTVGKWAAEVNKLTKSGKVYGPADSEEKCKDLIRKDLTKTLPERLREFAGLAKKTDNRDQKGYHSFELDWDGSVDVKDKCTKLVVGIKKSSTVKIGEIPPKDIIK